MQAKYDIDQSLTGAERTKARKRAAYLANREERIERARQRRADDPEGAREIARRAREKNPEKIKLANAKYRELNRGAARARSAEWRASNPERVIALRRSYYENNRDEINRKQSEWAEKNKEKIRAYHKTRYAEKYEIYVAAANARRARKIQATAPWDLELTELATTEAAHLIRIRRKATGIRWHADHIVPLRGKVVSGLHVWNNIAVIPAIINLKKGNRHE